MSLPDQHSDIYVRAHTVSLEQHKDRPSPHTEPKWSDYALVFDSESRITADQTLTLGFWRFGEKRNGSYFSLEEGIFHDDELSAGELQLLRKYARETKPDT